MSRLVALTKREIMAYFFAPVPYLVLFFFLLLMSYFFQQMTILDHQNVTKAYVNFGQVFDTLGFILLFLIPMLTMNSVADEKSRNTIETLLTAPVTDWQVIFSKWLGTFLFYIVMLAPTVVFLLLLKSFGAPIGKPDAGSVVAAYTGALLLGGLYIAIGVFASSITENALLSAFVAFFTMIALFAFGAVQRVTSEAPAWLKDTFTYMSQFEHFSRFLTGRIALHDVLYFVTTSALFLFLAVRALESRKWR